MPTSSERRSAPAKPTSSRARSRSPARSPPQTATSFRSSVEVSAAAWRLRLPCWRWMPRRVVRIAGSPADQSRPAQPVLLADRGQAALERGAGVQAGQRRRGRRRPRRAAPAAAAQPAAAPRGKVRPVGGVGAQRGRGEGVGGIGLGCSQRLVATTESPGAPTAGSGGGAGKRPSLGPGASPSSDAGASDPLTAAPPARTAAPRRRRRPHPR